VSICLSATQWSLGSTSAEAIRAKKVRCEVQFTRCRWEKPHRERPCLETNHRFPTFTSISHPSVQKPSTLRSNYQSCGTHAVPCSRGRETEMLRRAGTEWMIPPAQMMYVGDMASDEEADHAMCINGISGSPQAPFRQTGFFARSAQTWNLPRRVV